MYTILICNDNSLMTTKRECIMQRSKLVDDLQFLVPQFYNEQDMSNYTVQLEYVLPCSRKYCTEILNLSDEMYEDHLKYLLPFDTKLTSEHGEIEIQLTFVKTELDADGKGVQHVRKTSTTKINVIQIAAWSDIVPDSALSAIDERLIKLDSQMRQMDAYVEILNEKKVDNLVYNEKEDVIHLSANGVVVGDKVSVRNMLDDGIPVVDLNADSENDSDKEHGNNCDCGCDCGDNVVEFGYSPSTSKPAIEDSDIVEF